MAGHELIDAYVSSIARRLPADAVEEVADGLTETYHHHLRTGLDPDAAARSAVAEFGTPDLVVAAFVDQSPGRRTARVLLCSGPPVGLCWATTLLAGHAWTWPVPVPLRIGYGLVLLAVVANLAVAATAHGSLRRTRLGAAGGLGLVVLDATMLAALAWIAPAFVWPMALAIPASLTRMAWTVRALPRVLSH
jgi:hypothetical protein